MAKIDKNNMDTTKEGDEKYTPFYAVEPILKYLKPESRILCPFDQQWSAYVIMLRENGHHVYASHIHEKGFLHADFFDYTKEDVKMYDYIISNPPFSMKDEVIKRLYELERPFVMLLPVATIQSKKRVPIFKENGLEVLIFDGRVGYHNEESMKKTIEGAMFASAYFCKNVLPEKLIFENLKKYNRPLNNGENND